MAWSDLANMLNRRGRSIDQFEQNHGRMKLQPGRSATSERVTASARGGGVPVLRGIDPSSHRSKLEAVDNTRDRERVFGQKAVRCSDLLTRAGLLFKSTVEYDAYPLIRT